MSSSSETIVGCWQMVEAWDVNDPNKPNDKTYTWGQPPLGYWVYDPAGNVSVQISINPPLPDVNQNWWTLTTEVVNQSMIASFNNYYAYFGTYTVDYDSGMVTHNVTTDVLRVYTGTAQPRPFKIVAGELLIGDEVTYLRRFKRVASFGAA
ncbi:MAG TPA: lipocalin-like domain-containing protein [Thermoanaerobaculia bacterium]|nr:lipocalin-like domain-containing protein [Thermoanaerobaculia bacterium]